MDRNNLPNGERIFAAPALNCEMIGVVDKTVVVDKTEVARNEDFSVPVLGLIDIGVVDDCI